MIKLPSILTGAKTFHGNKITANSFAAKVKKARGKSTLESLLASVGIGCSNPKTVRRRIAIVNAKLA